MKRFILTALLLTVAVTAFAQTPAPTSLFDPSRLSVGLRAYRSFDEVIGNAGTYTSGWWAGVPVAWELTSPKDPSVKLPASLIASLDIGLPDKRVRGYVGLVFLLKGSGK